MLERHVFCASFVFTACCVGGNFFCGKTFSDQKLAICFVRFCCTFFVVCSDFLYFCLSYWTWKTLVALVCRKFFNLMGGERTSLLSIVFWVFFVNDVIHRNMLAPRRWDSAKRWVHINGVKPYSLHLKFCASTVTCCGWWMDAVLWT